MRAPAESTSHTMGMRSESEISVARTIFSTVRAPHDPAFTMGSLATTTAGLTVDRAPTGHHAVRREAGGDGVGEEAVLDERSIVAEQRDALAGRQLPLASQPLDGSVVRAQRPFDGVAHGRVRCPFPGPHRADLRRAGTHAAGKRSRSRPSGQRGLDDRAAHRLAALLALHGLGQVVERAPSR